MNSNGVGVYYRLNVLDAHPLLLNWQKRGREVQRILSGPIPIESEPHQMWERALFEAQTELNNAEIACESAGVSVRS